MECLAHVWKKLPIILIIFIIIIAKKQDEELKLGIKNSVYLKYNCFGSQ